MDLVIETLTGVSFELQVSPAETVMSVKSKIQRAEGIPISQQHLIWQNDELDDHRRLRDYSIAGGSTIRLVLGMRGGPLNAHRVPPLRLAPIQLPPSAPAFLPKFTRFPTGGRIVHLPRPTLPSLASLRSLTKTLNEPICPGSSNDADYNKVVGGTVGDEHSTDSLQAVGEQRADLALTAPDGLSVEAQACLSDNLLSSVSKKLDNTYPAHFTNGCDEAKDAGQDRQLASTVLSSPEVSIAEDDRPRLSPSAPDNSVSAVSFCEKNSQVPADDHPPGYPPLLPSRAFRRSFNPLDVSPHWRLYEHQGLSALSRSLLVRSPFAVCGSVEQDSDNSPPGTATSRDTQAEGTATLELSSEEYAFPPKASSAAATLLAGILSSASDCFGSPYQTSGTERLLDHPPYPFHWLRRPPRVTEDNSLPQPFVSSATLWDWDEAEETDTMPSNLLELERFEDDPDEDDDDSIEGKDAYSGSLDDDDSLADLEDYLLYYRTGDLLFGPPSLTTTTYPPYSYYSLRESYSGDLEADFGIYSTRAVGCDTSIKHHGASSWRQEYSQLSEKVNDLKTRMRDLRLRRQRRQKSKTIENEGEGARGAKPQLNATTCCTESLVRDTPVNVASNANPTESEQDTDPLCAQLTPGYSTPRAETHPSSRRRERRFATVTPPELHALMQSASVESCIDSDRLHTSAVLSAVRTSDVIRAAMPFIPESLASPTYARRPMSSVAVSSLPSSFLTTSHQSNSSPEIDTPCSLARITSNPFSNPAPGSNRPHTSSVPFRSTPQANSTLKGLPWLSPKSIHLLANKSSVSETYSAVSREEFASTVISLSRTLSPKTNERPVPLSPPKPLSPSKPGRRKRCSLCLRKTGLVGGYLCRCGRNFCSRHRYAELHACPFDYKAEARRTLIDSNPIVTAPKLPKI